MQIISKIHAHNFSQKLFIFIFFVILFFTCFLSFPQDDGLRHAGVAFSGDATWKDVYPFSYFSEYSPYSPWYGYDFFLKKSFGLLDSIPIHPSTLKFIFIKLLSLILVLSLFMLLILKSRILEKIDDFQSFLLAVICVFWFLSPFFLRSMLIRPFVFGTIFLILSIGASGFWRGCVYAIILIFLYPYLSWFYILPAAFCHFLLGNKKFGCGVLIVLLSFFILQQPSFWKLQAGVFASGSIREKMGISISELSFSYKSFYCMFVLILTVLVYPTTHTTTRKVSYGDLLLFAYFLPSIMYIRTFIDILLPLVFVLYAKSFMPVLKSILNHAIEPWKLFLSEIRNSFSARIPHWFINRSRDLQSKISLKPLLFILYGILILFVVKTNIDQLKSVNETEKILSLIPNKSTILSSFNQQYHVLFLRPDLKIIPSCEIGLPSPEIRNEYIDFFKSGLFINLASKTSATYLIEARDIYLNPLDSRNLEFIGGHDKLSIWKIIAPLN